MKCESINVFEEQRLAATCLEGFKGKWNGCCHSQGGRAPHMHMKRENV